MRFNEVVCAPLDRIQRVRKLVCGLQLRLVLDHSPCKHGYGVRHGKPKLHIVSSVVVASS